MREGLVSKIRDPKNPISESSALRVVQQAMEQVDLSTDASRWRRLIGVPKLLGREATRAIVTLAVGGAVVELLHLFRILAH